MTFEDHIFSVEQHGFEELALEVFDFQYNNVPVYQEYCRFNKRSHENVRSLSDIPFLPVEFFKNHDIIVKGKQPQKIFESSGTTGSVPSRHLVADLALYERSFSAGFDMFVGDITKYVLIALLPSYLERGNSSLVYMADRLIQRSGQNASCFVKDEEDYLYDLLDAMKFSKRNTILLGVSYALLDFATKYKIDFPDLIVMETGGMKGRREEVTREELHLELRTSFDVSHIYSEYGMTELLSQAYSTGNGIFRCPPWMKVLTRDVYEPVRLLPSNQTGAVNIIDLANIYSCSFIATQDWGKVGDNGSFEIIGRTTGSDIRGCNLMSV